MLHTTRIQLNKIEIKTSLKTTTYHPQWVRNNHNRLFLLQKVFQRQLFTTERERERERETERESCCSFLFSFSLFFLARPKSWKREDKVLGVPFCFATVIKTEEALRETLEFIFLQKGRCCCYHERWGLPLFYTDLDD